MYNALNFIKRIIFLPYSIFILILIVSIRPLIKIRIGVMQVDRIGRLAPEFNAYILKKKLDKINYYDLIFYKGFISNKVLLNKWKKIIKIRKDFYFIDRVVINLNKMYFKDSFVVFLGDHSSYFYLFNKFKQADVKLTKKEILYCENKLKKLGCNLNKVVCFHNRDSSYLETFLKGNWSHHDHRDFSVEPFIKSLLYLSEIGFESFRLGAKSNSNLPIQNSKIFDYVNLPIRSEVMDLYLASKCDFYVGSDSGIWTLPLIFRKPILMINATHLKNFVIKNYFPFFYIPKKIFSIKKNEYLNIREMIEIDHHLVSYDKNDLVYYENTDEEIFDFIQEFFLLKKQNFTYFNEEDKKLQFKLLDIYSQYYEFNFLKIQPRIGYSFLKKNEFLIS